MAALVLTLVLIAPLTTTVAGFAPNLLFDYDLGDTSAMYLYYPDYRSPPLINETLWETVFSDTPAEQYEPGMVGRGNATHIGSYPPSAIDISGSRAVLNFVGHGIRVTGSTNGTWEPLSDKEAPDPIKLTLNGQNQRVNRTIDDELFRSTNVSFGWVNAVMSGLYNRTISLNRTTIMTGMVAEATAIENVPTRVERVVQNGAINSFFNKKGDWSVVDHIGGVGGQDKIPFPHAVGTGDAQLKVTLPRNVSFLVINGTTGPNYNCLFINLSPIPPMTPRPFTHTETKTKWVAESIFHVTPLDPRVIYNLTLAPGENSTVALSSIQLYSAVGTGNSASAFGGLGTTSKDPINKGAIAGGVVGGVLGLALLGALGFWLFRWYQRNKTAPLRFERADDAQATPYVIPARQHSESQPLFQSAESEKAGLHLAPQQVYTQPSFAASSSAAGPSLAGGSTPSLSTVSAPCPALVASSSSSDGEAPANHGTFPEYKAQILTASLGRSSATSDGLPPGAAPR